MTRPDLDLIIRPVPWPSQMVALVDSAGVTHTSFIVHQDPETRALKVHLFRGDPRQPWREWAAEHFPDAPEVSFERMRADGLHAKPALKLAPRKAPPPPVADPRWYLTDPEVWRIAAVMCLALLAFGIGGYAFWAGMTQMVEAAENVRWNIDYTGAR